MKINIVRPTDGWVLQKIAEAWILPGSACSNKPDASADVNLWMNYAMFHSAGKMKKTNCDIGWFTHRENNQQMAAMFDDVSHQMDHCISMCAKTALCLPLHKTTVIRSAPAVMYDRRDLVLGVAGIDSPRKRSHLIDAVTGIPGVVVRHTLGRVCEMDMPQFYDGVDYVLVLSDNEGGPMSVPEAMARNKPVIAPDVGWCWDYPVVRYTDEEDLLRVIRGMSPPTIEEESAQIMSLIESAVG